MFVRVRSSDHPSRLATLAPQDDVARAQAVGTITKKLKSPRRCAGCARPPRWGGRRDPPERGRAAAPGRCAFLSPHRPARGWLARLGVGCTGRIVTAPKRPFIPASIASIASGRWIRASRPPGSSSRSAARSQMSRSASATLWASAFGRHAARCGGGRDR